MAVKSHFRVTLSGRFGTSPERFSYGVNLVQRNTETAGVFNSPDMAPNATVYDDIAADCVAFHGSAGAAISPRAVLDTVKIAKIGTDGKYAADPIIREVNRPGGAVSTGQAAWTPPQTAWCMSLTSDTRGASGRGRFYLPMPIVSMGDDCLIDAQYITGATGAAATFLNNLNNQPGLDALDIRVAIISSKGSAALVTGVRVGRVLDTMRSRRRSLDESYAAPTALA